MTKPARITLRVNPLLPALVAWAAPTAAAPIYGVLLAPDSVGYDRMTMTVISSVAAAVLNVIGFGAVLIAVLVCGPIWHRSVGRLLASSALLGIALCITGIVAFAGFGWLAFLLLPPFALCASIFTFRTLVRVGLLHRVPVPPACASCGYGPLPSPDTRCPECGSIRGVRLSST